MPWAPNVFASTVLSNLNTLRTETNTGVGYVLPGRDKIGQCLQNFVDDQIRAQNDKGVVRINPLSSESSSIFKIYV